MVKPNTLCNATAHVMDMLPTFLDLSGGKYPETYNGNTINQMDGASMSSLLAGGATPTHASICWEHNGNRAIRKGDWKLLYNNDQDARRWELYNIATDRTELHNLADSNPEQVAELVAEYEQWMKKNGVIPFDQLKSMQTQKKSSIERR